MRPLDVRRLGVVSYGEALELQRALVEDRKAGRIPDTLLLLQHPHVLTLGVKGDGGRGHILAPADRLAALGVEVFETGRGGDVTYHGPGQLVGYPILDLRPDRCDVRRYVRSLADAMAFIASDYGVEAGFVSELIGAWADAATPDRWAGMAWAERPVKIGAIGVRISRWTTMHGFALNVHTDLDAYAVIVPCGIRAYGVGSIASLGGDPPALAEVALRAAAPLSRGLDWDVSAVEDAGERALADLGIDA